MPKKFVYVGPIDEIQTTLDGVETFVNRGDTVEVSDEQAEALEADGGYNWKPKGRQTATTEKDGE